MQINMADWLDKSESPCSVMPMAERTTSGTDYITPSEASRIAYLSIKQLSRLADEGKIRYIRPGSHRRYLKADIDALLKGEAA